MFFLKNNYTKIIFTIYYLFMLKTFLQDLLLPYKNFLNWVINKTIFFFISIFIWIVIASPFFIILYFLVKNDNIKWSELFSHYFISESIPMSFLSILNDNIFILFLELLILVSWIVFFLIGYYYQSILNAKLFLEYQKNIKTKFFSKDIFKTFPKYVFISSLVWFFVSIPFLIFFVIVLFLLVISWGIIEATNLSLAWINYFTIIIFIFWSITIVTTFYLIYRYLFSFICYLEDFLKWEDIKKSMYYLKQSLIITKENKLFFSIIILLLIILFFIISIIFSFLQNTLYLWFLNITIFIIFTFLTYIIWKYSKLNSILFFSFVIFYISFFEIINIFWKIVDSTSNDLLIWIYIILNFLIFSYIFQMIVVSFYKNYLLKEYKNNNLKTEEIEYKEKKDEEIEIIYNK